MTGTNKPKWVALLEPKYPPIKEKLLTEEFRYFKISNRLLNLSKTGGDIVFSIVEGNTYLADDILNSCEIIENVCAEINNFKEQLNNAR